MRIATTPRLNVEGAANASNTGGSSWYVLDNGQDKDPIVDFLKTVYAGDNDFYAQILVNQGALCTWLPAHGAGTVVNRTDALAALSAGAEFLVTPNIDREVIELCCERNVLITPGALTPTEIAFAMKCGSKYVKVFPSSAFGPQYFKEVLAPLSSAKLIAVGGINIENAAAYIQYGAVGVGVGGSLCNIERIKKNDFAGIANDARELILACSHS